MNQKKAKELRRRAKELTTKDDTTFYLTHNGRQMLAPWCTRKVNKGLKKIEKGELK